MNADRLHPPVGDQRGHHLRPAPRQADVGHRRPSIAADEGVRGADGQTEVGGEPGPKNGPEQASDHDVLRDGFLRDHAPADRLGHGRAEAEGGDEIEKRSPKHGVPRGKDARSDHRRDRIRGVVKPVKKVKNERHEHNQDDKS